MLRTDNIVINVLDAGNGALNAILDNHILSLFDGDVTKVIKFSCDYRIIQSAVVTPANTETLAVQTVDTTAVVASTEYSLTITQFIPSLGKVVSFQATYVTLASGATEAQIFAAFKAQIEAQVASGNLFVSVNAPAATQIITALAGNPLMSVTVGANLSVANTTPGVAANGQGADLLFIPGIISGKEYSKYALKYEQVSVVDLLGRNPLISLAANIYVNETDDAGSFTQFNTALTDELKGGSGAFADNDTVSIIS